MPAIEFTPSSIFFETSLSTISGDAPGYSVITTTTGKSMFGNWSTCRRCSEKTPSTISASIIMVAKTGLWILTRVNHINYLAPVVNVTSVSTCIGPTPPISTTVPSGTPATATMVWSPCAPRVPRVTGRWRTRPLTTA